MIAAAENCAQLPAQGIGCESSTHAMQSFITGHGRLDPGVHLLSKPFTYADLAQKVRSILDSQRVG